MAKRQEKLIRELSNFLADTLKEPIVSKEDVVRLWGQLFNLNDGAIKNLTAEQWDKLLQSANSKIAKNKKRRNQERKALEKINARIAKDKFLSQHNISIAEITGTDDYEYIIKVYFSFGGYFLEGTVKELILQIRDCIQEGGKPEILKVHCPKCSSMNLRFSGFYCLCNQCGSLSVPDENRVVVQYSERDKEYWWAMALKEITG